MPLAAMAMIIMIASAFAWVFIYSLAIEPGQSHEFYQEYAQKASAIESIIFGIPFFFLLGRFVSKRSKGHKWSNVLALWACYLIIDVLITTVGFDASPFDMFTVWFIAHATKLLSLIAAAYFVKPSA